MTALSPADYAQRGSSLAEVVSERLRRAGLSASSPEVVQIREHNNRILAARLASKGDACLGWPGGRQWDRCHERHTPA